MIYLAFSIISGILTGLSFNLLHFSFIIWFSLVPFLYAISKSSPKKTFLCGLLFAFSYYGVAIFWVGYVTKLGLLCLISYLSFYCVLFSCISKYFLKKPFRIITLACLWILLEFLKENIWCGFGWANLGYSQYRNFHLIQTIDLFGVKFISFLIVMVNVFVLESFLRKKVLKQAVCIGVVFILCFVYSFYRLSKLEQTDSVKVSVIQPSIDQELKWQKEAVPFILDRLKILSKETDNDSLVVFPENSWPHILNKKNFHELKRFMKEAARNCLIGSIIRKEDKFYNSALLFDKKGNLTESYYKIRLVPFGEYVPLREALQFISVINSIGDMSGGSRITKFFYKDKKFSVLICFEDIFSNHVINFAKNSDFLINITNDAWFGGEPEASQHLGIMAIRAIENRISIVRSSNTGISGWVSFRGKINTLKSHNKEVFFAGADNFNVSLNENRSFYNRYGDVFTFFCAFLLLGLFVRVKYFRR